jgi:hypothetical protein
MIVNDWRGRIAYHLRSKDGINWKVDPGEAYMPGISKYEDGTIVDWFKYERIKILQDKHGRAMQADFAVIDVLKAKDKGSDNHSSKHICIPLTIGRLLTILDKEKITADTKTIRVKIAAEEDFNPHTDVDVESLRFGAPEQVNFGRGCKAIKTEPSGDDIIVTFDGTGNGITDNNFAARLLGKTSGGKLLFGYARLPWVNYLEPVLSPLAPRIDQKEDGFDITVEIQNFGQVPSETADIKIVYSTDDKIVEVASGTVPSLKPFEKTTIELTCGKIFEPGTAYNIRVIINTDSNSPVTFERRITPLP